MRRYTVMCCAYLFEETRSRNQVIQTKCETCFISMEREVQSMLNSFEHIAMDVRRITIANYFIRYPYFFSKVSGDWFSGTTHSRLSANNTGPWSLQSEHAFSSKETARLSDGKIPSESISMVEILLIRLQ